MSKKFTDRTELILGEDGIEKLKNSHVLLIGVGGVGSFLCRSLNKSRTWKYNNSRLFRS